jgi:sugar phosphate permease
LLGSLREGVSYARGSPHVRLVLTMLVAISTIAMNFNVLLPVLARQTLSSGPGVFGLIAACFGAGALVGGLLSAALSRASWKAIVAGAGGLGVAELVLAPLHSLGPAIVLLFLIGVCFTLYTANSNTVLQLRAPDHLRGRVIGFYYFAFNGLAPLGGILTGWLAATGGTELAFGVAGTVTALVALTALPQLPRMRAEPA